mmetsp:Transcript_38088/g.98736  ORF Transcript_38088/g.98736 Transcript_38088/m.98736 type:complete len:217 (+) Transcript_38088:509-1159(+)
MATLQRSTSASHSFVGSLPQGISPAAAAAKTDVRRPRCWRGSAAAPRRRCRWPSTCGRRAQRPWPESEVLLGFWLPGGSLYQLAAWWGSRTCTDPNWSSSCSEIEMPQIPSRPSACLPCRDTRQRRSGTASPPGAPTTRGTRRHLWQSPVGRQPCALPGPARAAERRLPRAGRCRSRGACGPGAWPRPPGGAGGPSPRAAAASSPSPRAVGTPRRP